MNLHQSQIIGNNRYQQIPNQNLQQFFISHQQQPQQQMIMQQRQMQINQQPMQTQFNPNNNVNPILRSQPMQMHNQPLNIPNNPQTSQYPTQSSLPLQQQFNLNQSHSAFPSQSYLSNPSLTQQPTQPPTQQGIPKRVLLKMTNEERGQYSSLFQLADRESKGRLVGKEGSNFLKKSGLPIDVLKKIWLISAQTSTQFLERDEFYIALRLIALAQNNIPFSITNIITNSPIPPLPVFNLKNSDNDFDIEEVFVMSEKDKDKYRMYFDKSKEHPEKISFGKSYLMWKSLNVHDNVIKKILMIVQPIQEKNFFNLKEFQVCSHFVFKSASYEIPSVLPDCMAMYLYGKTKQQQQQPSMQMVNTQMQQQQQQPVKRDLDSLLANMNIGTNQMQMQQQQQQSPAIMNTQQQQLPQQVHVQVPLQQGPPQQVEDNSEILNTLLESIEKELREYNEIASQNDGLRMQLHDIKDKIKQCKDQLVKSALSISGINTDLSKANDELITIKNQLQIAVNEREQYEENYNKEKSKINKILQEREELNKKNQEALKKLEEERIEQMRKQEQEQKAKIQNIENVQLQPQPQIQSNQPHEKAPLDFAQLNYEDFLNFPSSEIPPVKDDDNNNIKGTNNDNMQQQQSQPFNDEMKYNFDNFDFNNNNNNIGFPQQSTQELHYAFNQDNNNEFQRDTNNEQQQKKDEIDFGMHIHIENNNENVINPYDNDDFKFDIIENKSSINNQLDSNINPISSTYFAPSNTATQNDFYLNAHNTGFSDFPEKQS